MYLWYPVRGSRPGLAYCIEYFIVKRIVSATSCRGRLRLILNLGGSIMTSEMERFLLLESESLDSGRFSMVDL